MINYNTIDINRGIMHHISAKIKGQEHATVTYEPNLFPINDALKVVIRKRLVQAAGKDSKAFELEIANYSSDTFFDYVKDLKKVDDEKFIKASQDISMLLSECQKRNNIPGGVFIFLDCTNKVEDKGLYIVIKAELHEAITHKIVEGKSQLEVLTEIFLSPSQKLYKVGIICERENSEKDFPNNNFTCFIFDEQFRTDGSKPAEYFYKDFLGFSIDKNAKIQTKRFYDNTYGFILNHIPTPKEKAELIQALKVEFITNTETTVSPSDFSKKYIKDGVLRDLYDAEIGNYLPSTIVKDNILIEGQLNHKKITFPNNINISGKNEGFDENVKIIESVEELGNLIPNDISYTIVRIKGKPFSNA